MNHKRGKPKNARAGCLMCKYHKQNGMKHTVRLQHVKMAQRDGMADGLEKISCRSSGLLKAGY